MQVSVEYVREYGHQYSDYYHYKKARLVATLNKYQYKLLLCHCIFSRIVEAVLNCSCTVYKYICQTSLHASSATPSPNPHHHPFLPRSLFSPSWLSGRNKLLKSYKHHIPP